jgi:hypothetical protein
MSRRERLPATSRRKGILLKNPVQITEDEADAIISLRRLRSENPIPLKKVLKRYGYRVAD